MFGIDDNKKQRKEKRMWSVLGKFAGSSYADHLWNSDFGYKVN